MSTDSAKGWSIIVSGRTLAEVAPGDSVIIGRKPLRAPSGEELPRVDVVDPTKSMSKRHALFSVLMDGQAVLRDLNSTNGTFIVRDNGDLSRMPFGQDFTFARSPMHLQLGDVAIKFLRTDVSAMPQDAVDQPVQSLFSYAPVDVEEPAEPAGPGLSVDDILDLRTGEPTSAFQAIPKHKRQDLPPTFPPMSIPSKNIGGWQAPSEAASMPSEEAATADGGAPSSGRANDGEHAAVRAPAMPSPAQSLHRKPEPLPKRDLFQDALDRRRQEEVLAAAERAEREQAMRDAQDTPSGRGGAAVLDWDDDPYDVTGTTDALTDSEATPEGGANAGSAAGASTDGPAYTPVFEPGSVFERLSRGEFETKEPAVVVDGLNSDDARTTTDYHVQFQMARKRPLLPFLALNPHLYHELYEFLESLEDPNIDAGLEHNDGYAEYKKGSSR